MSTNKRAAVATAGSDTGAAQDHMNVLYTAHQVHALAQIVFQQITGGWSSPASWNAPAMGAFQACHTPSAAAGSLAQGTTIGSGTGMAPVPPPALFYWYP